MLRRTKAAALLSVFVYLALPLAARAQEGFPLDGTWRGEWGPPDGERTRVVMIMEWDGERINGMINPGPNSVPFDAAELDPSDWTVTIEATSPDGEPIVATGTLKDIGAYDRYIEGTWTQGGAEHPFRITRE